MKKIASSLIILILLAFIAGAQAPQSLNYQAVLRNGDSIIANTPVSVTFTIYGRSVTSGVQLYQETQNSLSTNAVGLFAAHIGTGTQIGASSFASIPWGSYNIVILAVNITSPFSMTINDTLASVPYALYANASNSADTAVLAIKSDTAYSAINSLNAQHANQSDTATYARYAPQTVYTQGPGISISNNIISNTRDTVIISGAHGTTVTNAYPNFIISSHDSLIAGSGIRISGDTIYNTISLTGGGGTTVGGTYPSYTVSSPAYTAGQGITINGSNAINADTVNITTTASGDSLVVTQGSHVGYTHIAPQTLSLSANGDSLSISRGNMVPIFSPWNDYAIYQVDYTNGNVTLSVGLNVINNFSNVASNGTDITPTTSALTSTFTLNPGTYYIQAYATGWDVGSDWVVGLYPSGSTSASILGALAQNGSSGTTIVSQLSGVINVSTQTSYSLEINANTGVVGTFGNPSIPNTPAQIIIQRIK